MRRRARPVRPTVLALGVVLLLAACGSKSSSTSSEFLNTTQTKRAIEASILEQKGLHATVVCPSEVIREKGVTFTCVATTPNGVKTPFHVVEANDRGYVEYSSATETPTKTSQTPTKTSTTRHKKP